MNYLLIVIMLMAPFGFLKTMEPQSMEYHLTPQVNCPGCILSLHKIGKYFEAHQLLKRFNPELSDISIFQPEEGSLLHCCVLRGECRPYFIKTLLEKGAQLELTHRGETPLLVALRAHNYKAAYLLIEAGALVDPVCLNLQRTCLHWLCVNTAYLREFASQYDSRRDLSSLLNLAQALITPKVPLSLKVLAAKKIATGCINKITADNCITELRIELIFSLLQYSKRFDRTYLSLISHKYDALLMKQRIEQGMLADSRINQKDKDGNTPLHLAAQVHAHPEFAFFLVSRGADRLIKNKEGQTPLQVAQKVVCNRNVCEYCDVLKEYLAQPQLVLKEIDRIIEKFGKK